ncbi:MAG TPA: DUF4412 domain-containing protein [Nitrospira sp.]
MHPGWTGLAVCWAVVGWLTAASAADFEGIVRMKIDRPDTALNTTSTYYIKGDTARVESERPDGKTHVMILDGRKHSMTILTPEKKVAVEIGLDGADTTAEHVQDALEHLVVERTGKSEKIAGYDCNVWRITDKNSKRLENEVCVAKGFGRSASFFIDPKRLQQSSQPSWVKQLVSEGGFALRTVMYGQDGKEISRTQATSIERKSLDGNLFVVPADYVKQDMSGMANRMKALEEQRSHNRAETGQPAGDSSGEQKPDVQEMMKQFQDMMKKRQQGGQ